MEPVVLFGMIFSLVTLMLIGGFILLFPITRRLGDVLESYLRDRKADRGKGEQIAALQERVEVLELEVTALADRQSFSESLQSNRRAGAVGAKSSGTGEV